jgi:hypothetical protein
MFQTAVAPQAPATVDPVIAYVARGTCEAYGARGTFHFTFQDDGKFLLVVESALAEKIGFDGHEMWTTDWSDLPRVLSHGEEQAERLGLRAWMGNPPDSAALDPRLHAQIERGAAGVPVRVSRLGMEGTETWRFADAREDAGRRFAWQARVDVDGELLRSFQVESFERASALDPKAFGKPGLFSNDARFDPSIPARLSIARALSGHVLTKASIDGGEAGWFILDTGAGGSTLIDETFGKNIDAPTLGSVPAVGVLGKMRMTVRRARSLTIGPLTIERPFLLEQDLSFLSPIHDEPIVGILGYDVLSRCVVEIDLGEDAFLLHDPQRFEIATVFDPIAKDQTAPVWQPLVLAYRIPIVPGSYEGGRRGFFRIDVGAAGPGFGNVAFHSPAVERDQLLRNREAEEADLGGNPIAIGTLEYFELGGCRFDRPTVVFAKGTSGPLSDEWSDGNIGVDFLKPFRLILDYANTRMAFLAKNCPPK